MVAAWNDAGTEAAFIDGTEAEAFAAEHGGEVHREGVVYVVRGVTRKDETVEHFDRLMTEPETVTDTPDATFPAPGAWNA
jgi:hypothetical protein